MLRVRTAFSGVQGAPWLATHYFTNATEDATAAQAAVNAVGAFWTAVRTYILSTVSWSVQGTVEAMDLSGHPTGTFAVTPSNSLGSASTQGMPAAAQICVGWHTGVYLNHREVRGRTFIPGLAATSGATNGTVGATPAATVQTAANALLGASGAKLSVWSKRWSGTSPVSSAIVMPSFAVLRSRRD